MAVHIANSKGTKSCLRLTKEIPKPPPRVALGRWFQVPQKRSTVLSPTVASAHALPKKYLSSLFLSLQNTYMAETLDRHRGPRRIGKYSLANFGLCFFRRQGRQAHVPANTRVSQFWLTMDMFESTMDTTDPCCGRGVATFGREAFSLTGLLNRWGIQPLCFTNFFVRYLPGYLGIYSRRDCVRTYPA